MTHYDPYGVVKDFEGALCMYTGAPFCVTTSSCTAALLLCCAYHKVGVVTIPKRTYVGVPMSILHAGGKVRFDDRNWTNNYSLNPYPIWDSARWLTSDMYIVPCDYYVCLSFHWSKTLGIQQGGAILHSSPEADLWLRKARFDGRTEGVHPKDDTFDVLGWHCMMTPEIAAEGLVRLSFLPEHNDPLPNDDYPDLSKIELFHEPRQRARPGPSIEDIVRLAGGADPLGEHQSPGHADVG